MPCSNMNAKRLSSDQALLRRAYAPGAWLVSCNAAEARDAQHRLRKSFFGRGHPAGARQKPYGILAPGPIGSVAAKAAEAPPAEDLWQFQDRKQWYEARFVAEDQPEWNPSRLIGSRSVGPGLTEVVLEVEASREKVPIRRAYKAVGQRCCVRVNGGVEAQLVTSTPPFPQSINRDVLLAVRGDIYAGATKQVREELSVMAKITLLLAEGEGADLKAAGEEDFIEVGPWSGTGLDLRGPICRFFRYPTVVILAAGSGIATAKALLEASDDVPSLLLPHRETSRLYYYAPNESSILYRDSFEEWEKAYNVRTMTTTRSFFDVFDDDDTLVYEPNSTAAVILTGGDEELEKQALQLCEEAEITCIVSDSQEQTKTRYLDSITIPQVEGVMHMHESENVSTDINADEDST